MATLLLQAAGAAIGSVFGPIGAALGQAAGALAGNLVDQKLLGGSATRRGSHLSTARIAGADEGASVPRLYGTARLGGTLIWATRFEEVAVTRKTGGKSGGSKVESYRYYANFAIGLCEGPVAAIRRIWADGRELDLTAIEMRFHPGGNDQQPDPLIEAKQGAGNAPAYRGLAYAVFERLPLDGYGNRIPLLQFEVIRPVGALERSIRAVTVIPGATEEGYATVPVSHLSAPGTRAILNRNVLTAATDWQASIDELTALCPDLESVALVVAWFGTDLRAGECRIRPGVEQAVRGGESHHWQVAGLSRGAAHAISQSNGGPAYGSTPSDRSVLQAIADLKARGLKVFLYPFLMMDIPAGNTLPGPNGEAGQPAYPWRGRIGGQAAAAAGDVAAFCGTASAGQFTVSGGLPVFSGNDEGYRRFILHYARLAALAGGVDGFIIGSELRGLTQLRDADGAFPFVARLMTLAADVRAMLGPGAKMTYAADWSEYSGFRPADGSGDVVYNLDPLWAHPAIDAVGIDNYMPLSDWRDEDLENGNPDGFRLADDAGAMRAAITAGEGFDWYYASDAGRAARERLPITDGLAGKPWVYRDKDIESWWASRHHGRKGGVEDAEATAWTPCMKPVWFTELGCPAIDKGAARPNVFVDPKSAESARPWGSSGARADSQQRRFLEAHLGHWQAGGPVDPAGIFLWTWDARPYPAFPANTALWADGANWRTGHWLNGRLGTATLADTLTAILADHGIANVDTSAVCGDLGGYVQADVASARDLIEPLMETFGLDMREEDGVLAFRSPGAAGLLPVMLDVLAEEEDVPLWSETRGHDSDYASGAILNFADSDGDYAAASVRSRHVAGASARLIADSLPAATGRERAQSVVEERLRAHHLSRRTLSFALPPQMVAPEVGDLVVLDQGPAGRFMVTRVEEGERRRFEAREFFPAASAAAMETTARKATGGGAASGFSPVVHLLDLPRYEGAGAEGFARVAVYASPWRRTVVSSSASLENYRARAVIDRPARVGTLAVPLAPGICGRFDAANTLLVDLAHGELASATRLDVLNGANRLAVLAQNGVWEVIGFCEAVETERGRWRLSGLLRALGGTDDAMQAGTVATAPCVVLDEAVQPLGLSAAEAGLARNFIAEPATGAGGLAGPFAFAGGLRAETPLSPVHLRARRDGNGDILIGWTRRGRIDADNWLPADIAMDEEGEAFSVEIRSADAALRTYEVSGTALVYPAPAEIADFGMPQVTLGLAVRQIGRITGPGIVATRQILRIE